MNIQILDKHLKEFLKTTANAYKIGECLALCGPSVERIEAFNGDFRYDIEITTNRVDTASVLGIAREAAAILPQFNVKAKFIEPQFKALPKVNKSAALIIKPDKNLNKRVMAVVIDLPNGKASKISSPKWMVDRLEAANIRSKNILVDITNYVMIETGHPTHVFDYDKLKDHYLGFRLSKKNESVTTFDGKNYKLPGDDIVIENKKHEIIDLPGIIGTKNSVVDDSTKRIIFFIDNNDPRKMRKTSLSLNIRTNAVQLNEKQVDPNLAEVALKRGVELYTTLAKGKVVSKIYDFYPKPYKSFVIEIGIDTINKKIGVEISKVKIISILNSLGFDVKQKGKLILVTVPSWRAHEVEIPEDIIEEIARIYGYQNLPSKIMEGAIPLFHKDPIFEFENLIKNTLKGFGGYEVYTLSLVSKEDVGELAMKLKNPLGGDTEYLRTSLIPSLIKAAKQNLKYDRFHLFEISNIYLPQKLGLPEERLHLAGIFKGYTYREAKGNLEALFDVLHLDVNFKMDGKSIEVRQGKDVLGYIEKLGEKYVYEFSVAFLMKHAKIHIPYVNSNKYPAQVEDVTIAFETNTLIGDVIDEIKKQTNISNVEMKDIYKNYFTFTVWYQDKNKTLTDKEVEKIRNKYLKEIKDKFGGVVKS